MNSLQGVNLATSLRSNQRRLKTFSQIVTSNPLKHQGNFENNCVEKKTSF